MLTVKNPSGILLPLYRSGIVERQQEDWADRTRALAMLRHYRNANDIS